MKVLLMKSGCRIPWLVPALMATSVISVWAGGSAIERSGNIFLVKPGQNPIQITSSGIDSDPDLSTDGSKVIFVRKLSEGKNEIWISDTELPGRALRPLVRTPLVIEGRTFNSVFQPRFSPDGKTAFFMVGYAATTNAILSVRIDKPEPKWVAVAITFQVVPVGKYAGDLGRNAARRTARGRIWSGVILCTRWSTATISSSGGIIRSGNCSTGAANWACGG